MNSCLYIGGYILPAEILSGIAVAYILDNFSHPWEIIRHFPVFYFFTKQITEQSSEIFMARK